MVKHAVAFPVDQCGQSGVLQGQVLVDHAQILGVAQREALSARRGIGAAVSAFDLAQDFGKKMADAFGNLTRLGRFGTQVCQFLNEIVMRYFQIHGFILQRGEDSYRAKSCCCYPTQVPGPRREFLRGIEHSPDSRD